MKRINTWYLAGCVLVAAVGIFLVVLPSWERGRPTLNIGAAEAQDGPMFTCGMHPQVLQRGPGTCPICGMDLVPVQKSVQRNDQANSAVTSDQVAVDPVMVQNMGVRVASVKRGAIARTIRTIGEVVVAEDLMSVVNLKFSGWIEKLYVDQTGVKVRRGQPLFRMYSPELVAAQDEYLLALRSAGKNSPLAQAARAKLKFWDVSDARIERLEQRGKARRTVTISAPRTGHVLHKTVVQGARVSAGEDLFQIGKLSAIWVHAQVYEFDAPWVKVGQPATMELAFQRGRLYTGKVSYIYPTLNPKSRTLTVRLEFINPELRLKPGMFATVRMETQRRSGILKIPTEAILYSGERLLVFVTKHVGTYEPREIETGMTGDDHTTEVLSGLTEGERVVTSGQFLLDSESQLQEVIQKFQRAGLQTNVPGTESSPADQSPASGPASQPSGPASQPSGPASQPNGPASQASGPASQPSPHAHALDFSCPMHPQIVRAQAGSCPICGMKLVKQEVVDGTAKPATSSRKGRRR